uniref:Disease resistance protein At4g27190-like leucine-rich repeats domain-containing protein n=1 Tax=Nelumbo nucifera TaxID=4432 RepID=A0A822ZIM1_NELNU|nr:TPA_asm: hypothetical protein HUJ06_001096 [Nelumbo nucifera]
MIPNGMLLRLPLLEDLSLNIGGVYWNDHRPVIDENWSSIAEAVAEELATLKRLNHLNFFFTKMESFSRFIQESCAWKDKCLTSFRLLVGCDDLKTLHTSYFEHEHEGVRYLRLRGSNDISNEIMEVLRRACAFRLICHETARYLSEFGLENMNGLEFCEVGYCKKMETLVLIDDGNGLTCSSSSNSSRSHAVLPRIEMLHLHNLHNFMTIWGKGPVPPQSLNCLRILKVENCPMLQYLFSKPAAQQLSTLQQLEVRNCPTIQEIVNGGDGKSSDDEFIYFLQLKHLKLVELPKLVSICKGVSLVALSSFSVRAYDCPNLKCEWWVDDGTGQMVKKA